MSISKYINLGRFAVVLAFVGGTSGLWAGAGDRAMSTIINQAGETIGEATYEQGPNGVVVYIKLSGLTPGRHGMHFHAVGKCEGGEKFKTAAGHIDPAKKPHGFLHPEGPHEGNLPNLIVAADGTAEVELYTSLVSISDGSAALLDGDGSTLIIHENPDDHNTQPIGGDGGRVACGLVEAAG